MWQRWCAGWWWAWVCFWWRCGLPRFHCSILCGLSRLHFRQRHSRHLGCNRRHQGPKNSDQLAGFQNFIIVPLTFLSGVFYSIHSLPAFWQTVLPFNPFFHDRWLPLRIFRLSDVSPSVSLGVVAACFGLIIGHAATSETGYKFVIEASHGYPWSKFSTTSPPSEMRIHGSEWRWRHFEAIIVSPEFSGKKHGAAASTRLQIRATACARKSMRCR